MLNIPPLTSQIILMHYVDEQYEFITKIPYECKICYDFNKEITLLYACKKKLSKVAMYMLKNHKDKCLIDSIDRYGSTALMYACKNDMIDVVQMIVTQFGNDCKPEQVNNLGNTSLMYACNTLLYKNIILYKYETNVIPYQIPILLINTFGEQCNPQQINKKNNTALIISAEKQMTPVTELLIDKFGSRCKIGHANNFGSTTLMLTCRINTLHIAKKLVKEYEFECNIAQFDKAGNNAFLLAISSGAYELIYLLMEKYGDTCEPYRINNNGYSSLMYACHVRTGGYYAGMFGHHAHDNLEEKENLAHYIIKTVGDKCKPEQINKHKQTAFMRACYSGMTMCAKNLAEKFGMKCLPEQTDKDNYNALMQIVKYKNNFNYNNHRPVDLSRHEDIIKTFFSNFGENCYPQINDNANNVYKFNINPEIYQLMCNEYEKYLRLHKKNVEPNSVLQNFVQKN
jgi:ankyrin repeat protein